MSEDKIELRSEEMQDILTRPPHILVRSGIAIICLVLVILFTGSFFFKYPDILTGTVVITTENPSVWLVAKSSGKISELNCIDHSLVKQGEILAVIENPAATADINRIKNLLMKSYISDSTLSFPHELLTSGYELGTVQNSFSTFVKSVTDYENFLSLNTTQKEKEALSLQIADHRNYSNNLYKQLELKQEEMKIAESVYERHGKNSYTKKASIQKLTWKMLKTFGLMFNNRCSSFVQVLLPTKWKWDSCKNLYPKKIFNFKGMGTICCQR